MRRLVLAAHQWIGLAAALFLIVIALSGSVLVFEGEIDRALNPAMSYVTVRERPLPVESLIDRVQTAYPREEIIGVRLAEQPDQAYELAFENGPLAMVDPYSGTILGVRDRETSLARRTHLLHTELLAGDYGGQIVAWATVAMLLLSLSGLILWWPRQIISLAPASSWKRTNFDLHNVLGFYSSLVLLVITLSGVLIAFGTTTDPLIRRLNRVPDAAPPQSTPVPGGRRISADAALAIAETALPGAFASYISVPEPDEPNAAIRILKKFPEDRTPAGRSRVYLDQFNGKVLLVENTRTAPPGTRVLNLKRSAHTGDIFGWPTRALYFIVSLGIALQAITGALIWWNTGATFVHERERSPTNPPSNGNSS